MRKYESLTNLHNANILCHMNTLVTVTEKIDGSNCSVQIKDGKVSYASRNQVTTDGWHNIKELAAPTVSKLVAAGIKDIVLYGEIFSSKILRRIAYGETKIRWFDCVVNGESLSTQKDFHSLMEELGIDTCVESSVMALGDALKIDVETFESKFVEDLAEGIVIKGYEEVFVDSFGNLMIIKHKRKAFLEKSKPINKPKVVEELTESQEKLLEYVNDSRVMSVISKHENVTAKNIGPLIGEVSQDAIEDFLKDFPEANIKEVKSKYFSSSVSLAVRKHVLGL